jgi:arylformamidase
LVFKTRNSELWSRDTYTEDCVSLTDDGARALVERGVRLVGIDYLSIGDEGAHRVLLGAGVVAIEGLDLRGVAAGGYTLVCAPLKLAGAEGAPARVLLLRE